MKGNKNKIEKAVIEKLESAYGGNFQGVQTRSNFKIADKYFLELMSDSSQDERFVVSFNKGFFNSDIQNMEDSYIQNMRRQEIKNAFNAQIKPIFGCEFKLLFSPGSAQSTGTYSCSTPTSIILADFDEFDEFFIISMESVLFEETENLKRQLEESGYRVTVHISGLVDPALYNGITESYYEDNDPPGTGKQFYSLYFDEGKYVTAED